MCENAPGPVSMLMSSSRWERGDWTNNEQTHQQSHNLKTQTDPPVGLVSSHTDTLSTVDAIPDVIAASLSQNIRTAFNLCPRQVVDVQSV